VAVAQVPIMVVEVEQVVTELLVLALVLLEVLQYLN
tara:strand:+ start:52 stop:159 length:108 start_codon:yes stop_codon:yes gene_type:complete